MAMAFPFGLDAAGRTRRATGDDWVRQALEQLLFTLPGERVNRPDFSTEIAQLVFAPATPELAAATRFLAQGALQRWLGDRVAVEAVEVEADGAVIEILVRYRTLPLGDAATMRLRRDFAA
jgi:phage baseplate assembly protein W